jgi:hypothetical protein
MPDVHVFFGQPARSHYPREQIAIDHPSEKHAPPKNNEWKLPESVCVSYLQVDSGRPSPRPCSLAKKLLGLSHGTQGRDSQESQHFRRLP